MCDGGFVDAADDVVDPCCGVIRENELKRAQGFGEEIGEGGGIEVGRDLGAELAAEVTDFGEGEGGEEGGDRARADNGL